MKKIKYSFMLFLLIFVMTSLFAFPVYAEEDKESNVPHINISNIFDDANLLTDEEEAELENKANLFEEKSNVTLLFVTVDDTNGQSSKTYSNNFYDEKCVDYENPDDGILLMIDMDNREIYINTVGKCIDMLSNKQVNRILENNYHYATQEKYYVCLDNISEECYTVITSYGEDDDSASSVFIPTGGSIVFSILFTGIVMIILFTRHNKMNKKPKAQTYFKQDFTVKHKDDIFIGTKEEVLHDYYKKQESSSRSSDGGGRSHGGGGHGF